MMEDLRLAMRHASDDGRLGWLWLVRWTMGGGLVVAAAIAVLLALGPGR